MIFIKHITMLHKSNIQRNDNGTKGLYDAWLDMIMWMILMQYRWRMSTCIWNKLINRYCQNINIINYGEAAE